jgi:hypothetical protein
VLASRNTPFSPQNWGSWDRLVRHVTGLMRGSAKVPTMSTRLILTASGTGIDGKDVHLYERDGQNLEVFVEGVQGLTYVNGIVKLNFFTRGYAVNEEKIERREVACRMIMTHDMMKAIGEYMVKHADSIKEKVAAQEAVRASGNAV